MKSKKTEIKGRDIYYDPVSQQIELKSNPPEHISSSELKVGSPEHKQKYPERYGYHYTSKLEQAAFPEPGTAPSEKINKDISYNSTTGKIFKDDPNVRIPQKDLVNQLQKENIADEWSGPLHTKMWLEKQKDENKSPLPVGLGNKYKSDIRTANQKKKDAWDEKTYGIKQRLKNVRGPHVAELIYKGMTPYEKGSHNAEQRRKNLDNPIGPRAVIGKPFPKDTFTLHPDHGPRTNKGIIKAFVQTPAKPEPPLKKEKDIRVVVQELADAMHKTKLKAHDNEYGRGGITEIVREKI